MLTLHRPLRVSKAVQERFDRRRRLSALAPNIPDQKKLRVLQVLQTLKKDWLMSSAGGRKNQRASCKSSSAVRQWTLPTPKTHDLNMKNTTTHIPTLLFHRLSVHGGREVQPEGHLDPWSEKRTQSGRHPICFPFCNLVFSSFCRTADIRLNDLTPTSNIFQTTGTDVAAPLLESHAPNLWAGYTNPVNQSFWWTSSTYF